MDMMQGDVPDDSLWEKYLAIIMALIWLLDRLSRMEGIAEGLRCGI